MQRGAAGAGGAIGGTSAKVFFGKKKTINSNIQIFIEVPLPYHSLGESLGKPA
jgi:hypothetical protein